MTESGPKNEPSDIDARVVLGFGLWLIFWGIVLQVAIWIFFMRLERQNPYTISNGRDLAPRVTPPPPQLQVAPQVDLQKLRESESALLNEYGWVDRDIVRLPIERAMALLLERALPSPSSPQGLLGPPGPLGPPAATAIPE